MDKLLQSARNDPLRYLPDKSVLLLRHFVAGYLIRLREESVGSNLWRTLRSFEEWLYSHYRIAPCSQDAFAIVASYSNGAEEAWNNFFGLFEQFENSEKVPPPTGKGVVTQVAEALDTPQKGIIELIRRIRLRPELFIGYAHLSGLHAYLNGYQSAGDDLGLVRSNDESLFEQFKHWLESNDQSGTPRRWSNVILFQSPCDCGHTTMGAYTTFFKYLDRYSEDIGKPGLFQTKSQDI